MIEPFPIHHSVADKLSPQFIEFYNQHYLYTTPVHLQSFIPVRLGVGDTPNPGSSPSLPVGAICDFTIPRHESSGPAVKIRCFVPQGESPASGWPVTLYYHGGGWVFGDINSENNICSNLCARAQSVVITTEYRLAPEVPFPAALDDSWETILWILSAGARMLNLDLSKVAISGASAGANLAAAMTQKLVARPDVSSQIDIRIQLLAAPVTDNTATVANNPTYKSYEHTASLSAEKMLWYRAHYLPDPALQSRPDVSPLLWSGDFARLPPAVILVGEVDILRHEGQEYARKLQDAGVQTRLEVMEGMPHPFLSMDAVLDEGRRAITILCESLAQAIR
ncbi:hypothetical protein DV738_g1963, partial [Chaetothyriales sp. CBS 135597]